MKLRYFLNLLVVAAVLSSCDKDSEITASIIGTWKGDKAEMNVKPDGFPVAIPYTLDDFNAAVTFKSDGSLTNVDDTQSVSGTFDLDEDQLTIDSDFTIEDINMSGTYHVVKLTVATLQIEIQKDATVQNPNTGSDISGKVSATLYFTK